ncbi:MAG: Prohead core protein serine protease, partial [Bacteroidota bacterium]
MSKQLLIEYNAFQPIAQSLTEGRRLANGNMVVSGLVQATDKPNANRRIYPYQTLFEQVQKYIAAPIAENRALGELDHPESS